MSGANNSFPELKHLSCFLGIWTLTDPSEHADPGIKSSLQFCLWTLSLAPALLQDSLPHSLWFFYATGMQSDKVTSYLLSFLFFFQNWVSDAKCTYSQWITFPTESFPAVTCVWYLLISTLSAYSELSSVQHIPKSITTLYKSWHSKYSLDMHYIKLKTSNSHLDLHRTYTWHMTNRDDIPGIWTHFS